MDGIKPFQYSPVNEPERRHLPHACGVYLLRDASMDVLYVGKAKDLARRVAQYFTPKEGDIKTTLLAPLVRKIDYVPCASERESLIWERRLILKHQPFFNSMWKDDKSYPYVKITLNEDYPRIFLTRQKKDDGAAYFGPYPKVAPVRHLLVQLWRRRFFALRPCDWEFSAKKPLADKKIKGCLYYHTRECPAPCAERITRRAYRRIAQEAVFFFQGKYGKLRRAWQREMRTASKALDYERAAQLRDNLDAIAHIGERVRCEQVSPERMEESLLSSRGVSELQAALGLERPPHHVEAFDISHFSGLETVGSMVCFKGGEPHKGHYRRFRIKTVSGVDDFRSMKEVVGRRYRRMRDSGSPLPDLVLIDGGKGQLSVAVEALAELKLRLPLAALAKRQEEVFLPSRADPVVLAQDSPALHLLQRLRDEAHRFAVKYHRLLRKKKILEDA